MKSIIDKNLVRLHFGKAAPVYDQVTPVQASMANELVKLSREHWAGKFDPCILEIGCGTGKLTQKLLEIFPESRITAIDISSEMIQKAKQNLKTTANVIFVQGDAESLADGHNFSVKFDLIVSNATFQWFSTPGPTLKKYQSLLAPKGILSFSTFGTRMFYELRQSFQKAEKILGIPSASHTLSFYDAEDWVSFMDDREDWVSFVKESFKEEIYPSVTEFLHTIKRAGAAYPNKSSSTRINKTLYQQMCKEYEQAFSNIDFVGISATYHIIYVIGKPHA